MPDPTARARTTTVCLVRHGETDWNAEGRLQGQEDTPLNATGRAQAVRAGVYLRDWAWDILVSSSLARARDTAHHIGQAVGLSLHAELPQFMERDYGAAAGMTPAQMQAAFPDGEIPGLESQPDLQDRIMAGLNYVAHTYAHQRVIVVAHGGTINAALARLTNGEIGSGKTQLGNACISLFQHGLLQNGENAWVIDYYNYQGHLTADTQTVPAAYVGVE
ncbi:MAG: histidine phosphatase family protein [Litorilinea sp.]